MLKAAKALLGSLVGLAGGVSDVLPRGQRAKHYTPDGRGRNRPYCCGQRALSRPDRAGRQHWVCRRRLVTGAECEGELTWLRGGG